MRKPPYLTELKPYGRALVDLARRRDEILVDLFASEVSDA